MIERDPKRLVVLKALTTFLENEIVEGDVYQHTLKDRVFRGRMQFDDDDPVPALSILDNLDPDRYPRFAGLQGGEHPTAAEEWMLLLQGWAVDDKCNPTDPAHRLMADVRMALAKLCRDQKRADPFGPPLANDDLLLGGLISGMTMEPGVVRPPVEDLSSRAFFYMRLRLKFVDDPNDPYKLGD